MSVATTMLSLFGDMLQLEKLFPLALMVVIVAYLLMSARRKQQRLNRERDEDRDSPQREPPKAPPGSKEQLRRDLESLIVELQELSRKISAEIDTRFAKLEAAMRDADRRIAALNRLSRETGQADSASTATSDEEDERYAVVYELADAGKTPVEIRHSPSPENAKQALEILGIVSRDDRFDERDDHFPRQLLEPWAVQAALKRRRVRQPLSDSDIADIRRSTRDADRIAWPKGRSE